MRDRLLVAFVTLTLAVVAVFLVERGYATSTMVRDSEQRQVTRSAEIVAAFLGDNPGPVTPAVLEAVLDEGERAVYVDPDGGRVEAVGPGVPDGAAADADLTMSRPVEGGGTLTLTRPAGAVDERVADALLPLVLLALGLAGVAAATAVWLARRLVRPFADLAEVAGRIGRGDYDVDVPRSTVPEADALALALRATTGDLRNLERREREFAVHASHDLRTPLTATRLELEDLALAPDTPPEVVARISDALGQLDRLSTAVAEMLDATRESRVGASVDIDLAALVRDTVARWHGLAPDRRIEADCDRVAAVRMPVGSLVQVMDVLIGNAVTHGEGTVAVSVSETPAYVEVKVADEGAHELAVAGAKNPIASGLGGLALATGIVEALGGQLRLTDDPGSTFSVVLPRSTRETVGA
ncbi:MAG TPA: HAMP domain-containing sensor histidine kinase [Nocardioidaceae bacterium]|nr:HAMP domain-containing sensor histidine kinase [Nocardioidaceae bacterium]